MRKKVVRAMITKDFAKFILEGVEGMMVVDNERKDGLIGRRNNNDDTELAAIEAYQMFVVT